MTFMKSADLTSIVDFINLEDIDILIFHENMLRIFFKSSSLEMHKNQLEYD